MRLCLKVLIGLLLAALLVFGLILLIAFPLGIFPAVMKQRLVLTLDNNTVTGYWQKLPTENYFDFYMFNTTNPDSIEFFGEKASVQEVGPYSFKENEHKYGIEYGDKGDQVFFMNNKEWIFNPETSCKKCGWWDEFVLPNAAYMAVSNLGKQNHISKINRLLLDFSLLLMGEYPYRKVSMKGVLFESYHDPLIDLMHSAFFKDDIPHYFNRTIEQILGFPTPDIPAVGYFPKYNNTNDESYVVETGKSDASELNSIVQWANSSKLHWWGDDYANDLRGTTDGSFNKPFPKKTDTYRIFRSFSCRTFPMHYEKDATVSGIDGYVFRISPDAYNTELTINKGYFFNDTFNRNYFPEWPCKGKTIPQPANGTDCDAVNCMNPENYCAACCSGSTIRGRVYLPPGLVALKCFPGHNKTMPIPAMISPPHFVDSPSEVPNSIHGLKPIRSKHNSGQFTLQTYTGNAIDAQFRLQLSIPVYQDNDLTSLNNMRSSMIPCFWLEVRARLLDYAVDYLHTNTTVIPKTILGVGIGLTALSCILAVLFAFCLIRHHKRRGGSTLGSAEFAGFAKPVSRPGKWESDYRL